MSSTSSRVLFFGLVFGCTAGATGCSLESPPVSGRRQALETCHGPIWTCYANSPEIDHYGFHDLNLVGRPNHQGIQLGTGDDGRAEITHGDKHYRLEVKEGRLRGVNVFGATLSGLGLVGAELHLEINGVPDYRIRIEEVHEVPYAVPYPDQAVETYVFSWYGPKDEPDPKRLLCTVPEVAPGKHELLGMGPDETLVFEGERIDATRKVISGAWEPDWINLGCAGHTLAKMHLTRHTVVSNASALGIELADRQATLKMLVADYCGTGRPFTQAGQPLYWRGGLVDYVATTQQVEARWTEKGAACLTAPRLKYADQLPEDFQPDIWTAIEAECGALPPTCGSQDPRDFDGARRVSANPH
ncbi:MAG: ADYC domain-containing protein [Kofleriaceae bacterium]